MSTQPVLQFVNVKKNFGENAVLTDVSFSVQPGEIVSLVGENGAGKSTLMNILFGMDVIRQTGGFEGKVLINGEEPHIKSPLDAIHCGIGMVHQEFMLIPGFSVAQNIKLNREPLTKNVLSRLIGPSLDTVNTEAMRRDAGSALQRVDLDVDTDTPVALLPVGIKQFVEICRELDKKNLRLLVFDEPTAVLTEVEAAKFLDCVKRFAQEGISVIFISHRLDEVLELSDRIVILRDGHLVANEPRGKLNKEQIAEHMVGRTLAEAYQGGERSIDSNDYIMEFRNVSIDMPGEELRDSSLHVRRGEILGIGGLAGHGKMAFINAVASMCPTTGGEILYNGEALHVEKIGEALRHNIGFVSEDRKGVGLLLDHPIWENLTFTDMVQKGHYLRRIGPFHLMDKAAARADARQMIDELGIKCMSPDQNVGSLSGGNQQKVCIGRVLLGKPDLLFVAEPTRGIDIGAKKVILNYLKRINHETGATVVVLSSELNELRSICDRIVIVANGQVQGALKPTASNVDFALMMSGEAITSQDAEAV